VSVPARLSREESLAIVEAGTILRATVGSTVHGLHLEAQDDRDEMAVAIEPRRHLIGFGRWEHHVERTQPEGVRSGPGDLDLVVYGLRKFCRLALAGNPTVLILLFTPAPLVETSFGSELRALTPAFISRRAGQRYKGYLQAQKERLLGTRGQRNVNRPELIEAHGYDTKYAMHVLRLAVQGRELMETGRLTFPVPEHDRSLIMEIRRGDRPYDETIALIDEAEAALLRACESSPLPEKPDLSRIEAWMMDAYERFWAATA
jgi:predicted nucleotidyltransferase